jgi:hypothetical protein
MELVGPDVGKFADVAVGKLHGNHCSGWQQTVEGR